MISTLILTLVLAPASPAGPAKSAPVQTLGKTAAPGATAPKKGEKVAVMDTTLGRIVLKFFSDKAPRHVKNFIDLSNKKFYDGTRFHRVIPGFMIQGGDPNTKKDDRTKWEWGDRAIRSKAR